MSSYLNPNTADFRAFFVRDFTYGSTSNTVTNADIAKAETQAAYSINADFFSSQEYYSMNFLYLSAHYLVMDLRAASQGVNGQFPWSTNSKAVGNVSESFSIPDRILANPEYAWLSKTYYGAQYLMNVLPFLSGQIFNVCGTTNP